MRFARQARIFRGTLDPAAVAGVFLLLLIFLMLTTLVRTPGVLIELGEGKQAEPPVIRIARSGAIIFDGKTYPPGSMQQLRADLQHSRFKPPLTYQADSGAPRGAIDRLNDLVQIQLPIATDGVASANPTVVVYVNFLGQFFFDNQVVTDAQLKALLADAVARYKKQARDLTVVLYEDRDTHHEVNIRLFQIATEAGVKQVLEGIQNGGVSRHSIPSKP
jgi:biopolymer transport protein ExbD